MAALDKGLAEARVDVLVLGPDVSGRRLKPAAKLRKELLKRCKAFGASVLGEHREMIEIAEKRLGRGHNLCTYEVFLAGTVDLIVLLPASPGSIAELGLFSLQRETAPKTLILFAREYKGERSYIMDGPTRAIEMQNAKIEYVDYGQIDRVWDIVEGAIEKTKAIKLLTYRRQ